MNEVTGLTFSVGSVDYQVAEVDGFMRKYELYGQVTYSDCRIEIEPTLTSDRKANVVIHELLHAMLFEAGYDEHDEEQVRRLGNVLTQVLRDNMPGIALLFYGNEEVKTDD